MITRIRCRHEELPKNTHTRVPSCQENLNQLVEVFCNTRMDIDIRRAALEQLNVLFRDPEAPGICTSFQVRSAIDSQLIRSKFYIH